MTTYRKFACHRLYDSCCSTYPQQVVTLDNIGRVVGFASLTEETAFTEWIGGVIVLSAQKDRVKQTGFHSLLQELITPEQTDLYAWHISSFDFENEALTPQSIIRRL